MDTWAATSLVIPNLWALESQVVPGPRTWALHLGSGCAPSPTTISSGIGENLKVIRTYTIFEAVFDYPIPANQEDPTTIGYGGLQQNESSPVASWGSRVDAAGPSSTVPCNPLFTQGHQASSSSNRRVHTHDATSSPLTTQVGGGWDSVPYAGEHGTIPSLTVATSPGSQCLQPPVLRYGYEASSCDYGTPDAPQPLEAPEPYAQSLFGACSTVSVAIGLNSLDRINHEHSRTAAGSSIWPGCAGSLYQLG